MWHYNDDTLQNFLCKEMKVARLSQLFFSCEGKKSASKKQINTINCQVSRVTEDRVKLSRTRSRSGTRPRSPCPPRPPGETRRPPVPRAYRAPPRRPVLIPARPPGLSLRLEQQPRSRAVPRAPPQPPPPLPPPPVPPPVPPPARPGRRDHPPGAPVPPQCLPPQPPNGLPPSPPIDPPPPPPLERSTPPAPPPLPDPTPGCSPRRRRGGTTL